MLQHSRICPGTVRHRRYQPKAHAFAYPVYMSWIDLDELSDLDTLPFWSSRRFNLVQFRRKDYLGPKSLPLKEAVQQRLKQHGIREIPERICVLTNLRNWGLTFNPVTFYVCYRADGGVIAILSEINNTPWDERHCYVHEVTPQAAHEESWQFEFDKVFHVSPFMPMDLRYQWRFRFSGEQIWIHMRLWRNQAIQFDASLGLDKKPLNHASAWQVPLRYPFMTLRVVSGIYWQALRLWLKKIPFYEHPNEVKNGTTRYE